MAERLKDQPEPEIDEIVVDPEEILRRRILERIAKWSSDQTQYKSI